MGCHPTAGEAAGTGGGEPAASAWNHTGLLMVGSSAREAVFLSSLSAGTAGPRSPSGARGGGWRPRGSSPPKAGPTSPIYPQKLPATEPLPGSPLRPGGRAGVPAAPHPHLHTMCPLPVAACLGQPSWWRRGANAACSSCHQEPRARHGSAAPPPPSQLSSLRLPARGTPGPDPQASWPGWGVGR